MVLPSHQLHSGKSTSYGLCNPWRADVCLTFHSHSSPHHNSYWMACHSWKTQPHLHPQFHVTGDWAGPAWSLAFFFPYETVSCEIMLKCRRRCCNEQKTSDLGQRGIKCSERQPAYHTWELFNHGAQLSNSLTLPFLNANHVSLQQEADVLTALSVR